MGIKIPRDQEPHHVTL